MFRNSNNESNAHRRFRRLVCSAAPLLLLTTACTETNDLVIEVGTMVLVVADRDLRSQGPVDADLRIQVAEWEFAKASLTLEGDPTAVDRDLTFGDPCEFVDTALNASPVSICTEGEGEDAEPGTCKCAGGVILGVGDGTPIRATVDLMFTMKMRRGVPETPETLDPNGDEDGDGIANALDACPFLIDVDEETDCAVDTDGDGRADLSDNCPWDTNPEQEDTTGLSADGIPDGIGDSCMEQVATVRDRAKGSTTIALTLDAGDITDLDSRVAFLVVDFQSGNSIECDWRIPECLLDTSAVVACMTTGTPQCP